jgi:hypothetical protein
MLWSGDGENRVWFLATHLYMMVLCGGCSCFNFKQLQPPISSTHSVSSNQQNFHTKKKTHRRIRRNSFPTCTEVCVFGQKGMMTWSTILSCHFASNNTFFCLFKTISSLFKRLKTQERWRSVNFFFNKIFCHQIGKFLENFVFLVQIWLNLLNVSGEIFDLTKLTPKNRGGDGWFGSHVFCILLHF